MQWSDLWTDEMRQMVLALVTVIVGGVLSVLGVAAKGALQKWHEYLDAKLGAVDDERIRAAVSTAVAGVEQMAIGKGAQKLAAVWDALAARGISVEREEIEAAVRLLNLTEGAMCYGATMGESAAAGADLRLDGDTGGV